jgi:hypothetical protein
MEVHLIDGTYELFRHFFALPPAKDSEGREVAAVRGVLGSLLGMMKAGTTYIGVATDHVIESFRNRMWHGYKTGKGVEPELLAQFPLLEETLCALGVVVWAMEEYEADDALASAAFLARKDMRVRRVVISTPDKDLAQCVQGTRIVQLDRRRRLERDEQGVVQKFGVKPSSIPDYLALVGDRQTAIRYIGLRGVDVGSNLDAEGRPRHVQVSYDQKGITGSGSVDIAFVDGVPSCLYFADDPSNCKAPSPSVVKRYEDGDYRKKSGR